MNYNWIFYAISLVGLSLLLSLVFTGLATEQETAAIRRLEKTVKEKDNEIAILERLVKARIKVKVEVE